MTEPQIVDVTITAPDVEWLAEHTRSLIEERLVASGNLISDLRSIYRWQGNIEDASEAYVILHTQAEHVDEIIRRTNEAHPYDTVHILATTVTRVDPKYASWIAEETKTDEGNPQHMPPLHEQPGRQL